METEVTRTLKIKVPIVQAPMAGGVTTKELVSEVSNSGGLGMIGAGYLTADQLSQQIRDIKRLTSQPFGANLFVPKSFQTNDAEVDQAKKALKPYINELKLDEQEVITLPNYEELLAHFKDQVNVIIEERVPVCSFTFDIPSETVIQELKKHSILLIGTATTVEEAIEIEKKGLDMVVVQGSEAGGHRGHFIKESEESLIGLMSLIPQVADHVTIPVIAAGGIMDGRGIVASLILGAQAVQMGTAFLTCLESGANPLHKEAILNAKEDQLILTRAFSGKWARGIKNTFISDMQSIEHALPEFPIQNALTKQIRKTSAAQGNRECMSLWSGQSPRLAKNLSVSELMRHLVEEVEKIKGY